MRKEQFYISFNADEPGEGGGGSAAVITISLEEHKALLESSNRLKEAETEKQRADEEMRSKIKQLEEDKEILKKEKETAENSLADLETSVKNEYLEKLNEDHRKIAALIPSLEGLAKYVKLNEAKLPAATDTARPGTGSRDSPGAKWDDLSYDEKEDLRVKRPALWKKLYKEKFGTRP